ncbi:protoheme IX farnesyltransferase [Persicimonas caeni]|uniref:Protoheme IX farnesyltransferase n=1 Tax=Persicimonas caeni TaxID=2292766 RepID=A0A4Y6PPY6_PERCE|nr:heme o synthase [Persicimonas caeni]QDG50169.1 protoheme IX farnesyltransferase [Persicimonas caeni]QED31390.1 protoheme IX farnesyltransferase [Persicimonas caeni]
MQQKQTRPRDWLSLTKPGIVVSNVMTAAAGLWLAPGAAGLETAVAALVGTGLLVAGSGAFNQVLERDTDAFMDRTSTRPLAAGRLEPLEGIILGCLAVLGGLLLLGVYVNMLCAALGALATGIYAFVYTPLKRRTFWAVPIGAVSGALPPVMGWTAVTGAVDPGALVLFSILFWWQIPHFLGIALYRAPDYLRAGLKIAPESSAYPITIFWARLSAILTLASVAALPFVLDSKWVFFALAVVGTVGPTVAGFRRVPDGDVAAWGRKLFFSSLATLPLLALGALVEVVI